MYPKALVHCVVLASLSIVASAYLTTTVHADVHPLDAWLLAHPKVADQIVWEFPPPPGFKKPPANARNIWTRYSVMPYPSTYPALGLSAFPLRALHSRDSDRLQHVNYAAYAASNFTDKPAGFDAAFSSLVDVDPNPVVDPPLNLQPDDPNVAGFPMTVLDSKDAFALYVRLVAAELAMELNHCLPWSLARNPDSGHPPRRRDVRIVVPDGSRRCHADEIRVDAIGRSVFPVPARQPVKLHCSDLASSTPHDQSLVMGYAFKSAYTVPEMEAKGLWSAVEAKIPTVGGCAALGYPMVPLH